MRYLFGFLLALLILVPTQRTCAQQAEPEVAATLEAKILELLELTGSADLGVQVMDQMMGPMKELLPQIPDQFWEEFKEEVDPEQLVALTLPIYARHFTEEEIDALLVFYRTDVGQSVIRKMPLVMQESMAIGNQWGQELAMRALERMKEKGYDIEQ